MNANSLFENTQPRQSFELRYYQEEAIQSCYSHLRKHKDNPCIVLPTGAGKTPVMATICHDAVSKWNGRVLVVSHVKELVEQTADTLASWYPDLKVGVYSAGLGRRETRADILVAGIQSIYKKGLKLAGTSPFQLVLVDEAHRIPTSGDGMYRQLLTDLQAASPKVRVIGLTATPYRLKGGYVCGPKNFLNQICYEAGVRELIAKGYLCRLVSKESRNSIDDSKLTIKNGEFDAGSLSDSFDSGDVVSQAVAEILEQTADRSSVLIFCCDVAHAKHVAEMIESVGEQCGIVTGETPNGERDQILDRFKEGSLKYLCNVNVLTEGFDARRVDCVVMLRATLSPGLYYQCVGRGLRTHESKETCLVLDFGGNVLRHGCIDAIRVKGKSGGGGGGEAPARTCSQCGSIQPVFYASCLDCGYEFPSMDLGPNHDPTAHDAPITTDQLRPVTYQITEVGYVEHIKRGADDSAPRTLRVMYYEGMTVRAQEWVCVEHGGMAGDKAADWWSARCAVPMPQTAAEAARLGSLGYIAEPTQISVIKPPGDKFTTISKYYLGPIPNPDDIEIVVDEWGEEVRAGSFDDDNIPF